MEAFSHVGTNNGVVKTTLNNIGADVCHTNLAAFVKYKSMGSLPTNFGADVCHTNLAVFVKFK